MKTQKTILSLLFAFVLLGLGCSKDDPVVPKQDEVTKITLSTEGDVSNLVEGAKVKFAVKDNKDKAFTKAKIYVDGKEITGMEHTFAKAGDFKVYAKYGKLKSNEITIKVKAKDTPVADTKLKLSVEGDVSNLTEGAKVKFVVKDDKNKAVTNAEIYVAGKKITGMEHTFATAGTFKVYAKQGKLKSNEIVVKVKGKDTPVATGKYVLSIKSGKTTIKQGESVEFKLVDPKGNDVKLGEGVEIDIKGVTVLIIEQTAKPYTFRNPGVYEIQAKIFTTNDDSGKHIKSNIFKLTVESDGQARSYTPKVLFHMFTSTACTYCAHTEFIVEEAKKDYAKNFIKVAIHKNISLGQDPFAYSKEKEFKTDGTPVVWFDYDKKIGGEIYYPKDVKAILKNLSTSKRPLGLAINYDLANNKVAVKVGYDKAHPNSKLVVFLVEDGLVADQANGDNTNADSPAKGKGDPIKNHVHDRVLRHSLTNTQGDPIPDAEVKGNLYSKEFDISNSKGGIKDINKTRIVAYVIDSTGKVVNAQMAKANTNQDFD